MYKNNFTPPGPPAAPEVSASGSGQGVILNWGNNFNAVEITENFNSTGRKFEGYNVYQLASADSTLKNAVRLATYDVKDGITSIVKKYVDPFTGRILTGISQYATDSGIKRYIELNKDTLTGLPFINGTKYYFAVTAYSYNSSPLFFDPVQESSFKLITVIPQSTNPGERYLGETGQQIEVEHTAGGSTTNVLAEVIDPSLQTGDTYKITFDSVSGSLVWNLTDVTTGAEKLRNISFSDSSLIIDGILLNIRPASPGFGENGHGIVETNYGGKALTPSQYDASGMPYNGNTVWLSPNSNHTYFLEDTSGTYTTDHLISDPGVLNNRNFEIRFTAGTNYGVKAFTSDSIITMPFQIWDLGQTTPDDQSDDRQMIPFVYENKPGYNTIQYSSGRFENIAYPASDRIFFADPQGKDGYQRFAQECIKLGGAGAVYDPKNDGSASGYWADRHGGNLFSINNLVFCYIGGTENWPPAGTVIRFYSNKLLTVNDVFEFKSPGILNDMQLAKEDVQKINVFPTPY